MFRQLAHAPYEPGLWFALSLRPWTFLHFGAEELDRGGTAMEIMARKKGDLIPVPEGVPVLLGWVADPPRRDERLLRAMHMGRFHDPVDEGIVARAVPRTETLQDNQTLMGFSRGEIVEVANECPLCNGTWALP